MTLTESAVEQLFADIDAAKITMSKLAREAGVSRMTLNNWRTGRTLPTLEKYLSVRQVIDETPE
jgi:transcriptional regulator with XRE-family HTH domain